MRQKSEHFKTGLIKGRVLQAKSECFKNRSMAKNKDFRMSKSGLAIILSRLKGFYERKVRLEQYTTPSEIAAEVLWNAYFLGDIEGKDIADLGCGIGSLGLGAILLGANSVFFVEVDKSALETAKINYLRIKSESFEPVKKDIGKNLDRVDFIQGDISEFNQKVDVVLQNPPFGTKQKGKDVYFLERAFQLAKTVYSFHKSETLGYIKSLAARKGFSITHIWNFKWPLRQTYSFHSKRIERINVSCLRFKIGGFVKSEG